MVYRVPADHYAKRKEVWLCWWLLTESKARALARLGGCGSWVRLLPLQYKRQYFSTCMTRSAWFTCRKQESAQAHGHFLTTSPNSGPAMPQLQVPFWVELIAPETRLAVWYYQVSFSWRGEGFLVLFQSAGGDTAERTLLQLARPCGSYLLSSLGLGETPWHLTVANNRR